ncbi:16S RNA G1207 methylase RsmC [Actinoplanes sp. SE50]|uniref:class I SAM-dependent methyltransferase n=1 Tax=unclassified Actinoplanes TaxID=2626549 RepID=UPI00023ED540|nr:MULTISPECIES: methyltransferase [unclassified Actinoplanes]AEV81712.1 methyltransferase small [Actinoplanes sp. SE50/110]ATO80113.1 16S RNA G1207 methylase RsmC [Actinoplanes sp. SE50]SLL97517.1 16S RNA G1207 methylase RsmC [Actinoplanes sp. SE50/110]
MSAEHYFSTDPDAPLRRSAIEFSVAGRDYRLAVANGVFSAGRLDPGTAVLLRKAELPGPATEGALLDIGCGYGPITCVLASEAPRVTVHAIDVNSRARELTVENAAALGLAGRVRVSAPDDVPAGVSFTQIWSNPPTHVGKAELHALMDRWLPRLAPGGVGWLVINRNLGGDSLHTWLTDRGWVVERIASQKGFRVLRVTGKPAAI